MGLMLAYTSHIATARFLPHMQNSMEDILRAGQWPMVVLRSFITGRLKEQTLILLSHFQHFEYISRFGLHGGYNRFKMFRCDVAHKLIFNINRKIIAENMRNWSDTYWHFVTSLAC